MLLCLMGCNTNQVIHSDLKYYHFSTTKGNFKNIEFDYPKDWGPVSESKIYPGIMSIADPEYANSKENLIHGTILIAIFTVEPGTIEQEINNDINSIKKVSGTTIIKEMIFFISGFQSHKLVAEFKPTYYITPYLNVREDIFIPINDSTYYWFILEVPESERNGAFGQGFDKVMSSLVIKSR